MRKQYMKKRLILVLAILLAYLTVTVAMAQTVDPVKLKQIKPGVTTEAEVRALLGEPTRAEEKEKSVLGGRKFIKYKVLSYGTPEKEVFIHINQEGKVSKIIE
jgi:hypothetical protein